MHTHNVTETSSRQQQRNPVLNLAVLHVKARADDAALVDAAVELDDKLAGPVVVNLFKLVDVAVLLHDGEEADDDFGRGPDQHLALACSLGVRDVVEALSPSIVSSASV